MGARYNTGREPQVAKITSFHVVHAFISLVKDYLDWDLIQTDLHPEFESLLVYNVDSEYVKRLRILGAFLKDYKDFSKPILFIGNAELAKDLVVVLAGRYFKQILETQGRYLSGVDCKSLLYIHDVYRLHRSEKNNQDGPAELALETEQDLTSEFFMFTAVCSDSGYKWMDSLAAVMENRTFSVLPHNMGKVKQMVTLGFFEGTVSDLENNPSNQGIPKVKSFFESKEYNGWKVVDMNTLNGFENVIVPMYNKLAKDRGVKKSDSAKIPSQNDVMSSVY